MSSVINDCINIENNVNTINKLNESIKKCKQNNEINIQFSPKDEFLEEFIKTIKNFGNILNFNFDFNSLILKNKEDLDKFANLLLKEININNIKLLYSSSKDGLKLENVVNKINNKSNLIFLYLTGNKRIFGAYIKTKLENIQHNKYYKDENAFVFSLNNNKIYKILVPQYAIRFHNDCPILIGNNDNSNGFYFSGSTSIYDNGTLNSPKVYDFQKNEELTEDLDSFNELEIFEINFK